ncbi:MAG: hypothetical protein JKY24_08885 [Pseudomonadales bacterium]|nr:hypothetical protein [Pseudomonadales bacterium]
MNASRLTTITFKPLVMLLMLGVGILSIGFQLIQKIQTQSDITHLESVAESSSTLDSPLEAQVELYETILLGGLHKLQLYEAQNDIKTRLTTNKISKLRVKSLISFKQAPSIPSNDDLPSFS